MGTLCEVEDLRRGGGGPAREEGALFDIDSSLHRKIINKSKQKTSKKGRHKKRKKGQEDLVLGEASQ